MNSTIQRCSFIGVLLSVIVMSSTPLSGAEIPEAPKVSTFAPAGDLASQLEAYVQDLASAVKSEAEYTDAKDKVARNADTVLLIALALGLHDKPNRYKEAAPRIVEVARSVAAAENYKAALTAVESLQVALNSKGDPSKLSWQDTKSASLEALMKEVPLINTKMKRYLRGARFKKEADQTAGQSAVLAVIAHGSMPLAAETEKPNEAEKWYIFCADMREAAAKLNKTIRAQDESAAEQAVKDLTQSCDDCHAVFQPNASTE